MPQASGHDQSRSFNGEPRKIHSGQEQSLSYNGESRKIQSPSCSAISVHSDDETVNFTACTELSAGVDAQPNSSICRFPNEPSSNSLRDFRDNSSPGSNHWDSRSVHDNSVQSNESALAAMLFSGIGPSLHRMEAPALSGRQKARQLRVQRLEQVANILESQLDEVESSHGSYEVTPCTKQSATPSRMPASLHACTLASSSG
jgi:hypothetical protein